MIVNDVRKGVPVRSLVGVGVCALLVVAACEAPPPTALQQETEVSAAVVTPGQETAGAGRVIRVTGRALSGDETPLIFLDGVRIDHLPTDLDPATIESIEVMKGEAARAMFGEAAADGVIKILLKPAATELEVVNSGDDGALRLTQKERPIGN